MEAGNLCPVCRAKFRGSRICSRCGADLEPLMLIAAKAWRLRESARAAIGRGDAASAAAYAERAEQLRSTSAGAALVLLARWIRG